MKEVPMSQGKKVVGGCFILNVIFGCCKPRPKPPCGGGGGAPGRARG